MIDAPTVTDGGLETDLIFHHGVDLPEFAAFPLLESEEGQILLTRYFEVYADIARPVGHLLFETPTWRANPDWGAKLGYDAGGLNEINQYAIGFMRNQGDIGGVADVKIGGTIGPRGDGYRPGAAVDPDEAAEYHRPQLASFAAAGADLATAYTLTDPGEAIGIVRAARDVGMTIAISFTVETDGALPGGTSLRSAIETVDAAAAPDWFLVNCAHPTHVAPAFDDEGPWLQRILGMRANASTQSHAELDEATELDDGDPSDFAASCRRLEDVLPNLLIRGGCCGTDSRHVAALWGVSS